MFVAGIDYSTHAVDVVLVHLDDLVPPEWTRYELVGEDAFDRSRDVDLPSHLFEDVIAVGIEEPRGHNAGVMYRVQGAILAHMSSRKLVHPLIPSQWRKLVGLPGNATKNSIREWSYREVGSQMAGPDLWPQDAHDAHCIALATRSLIETQEAA